MPSYSVRDAPIVERGGVLNARHQLLRLHPSEHRPFVVEESVGPLVFVRSLPQAQEPQPMVGYRTPAAGSVRGHQALHPPGPRSRTPLPSVQSERTGANEGSGYRAVWFLFGKFLHSERMTRKGCVQRIQDRTVRSLMARRPAAFEQLFQSRSDGSQPFDLLRGHEYLVFRQFLDRLAGCAGSCPKLQHFPDFQKCEPEFLGIPDEGEANQGLPGIFAVAGLPAGWWRDQTLFLLTFSPPSRFARRESGKEGDSFLPSPRSDTGMDSPA